MTIPSPEALSFEPLINISLKFPQSLLAAIDDESRSKLMNRSAWVRQVIYRELTRSGGSK